MIKNMKKGEHEEKLASSCCSTLRVTKRFLRNVDVGGVGRGVSARLCRGFVVALAEVAAELCGLVLEVGHGGVEDAVEIIGHVLLRGVLVALDLFPGGPSGGFLGLQLGDPALDLVAAGVLLGVLLVQLSSV